MTTWTAPEAPRDREPFTGSERAMLQGFLDLHRRTLLGKCTGLTAEQLKVASVEPSNLTLLGLVRHMTEVEMSWFRDRVAGEKDLEDLYWREEQPDADFENIADADAEACFAQFHVQVAAADAAVAGLDLDHEFTLRGQQRTLRWVYIHMIEEYARHNGHADLLRERVDGATGE